MTKFVNRNGHMVSLERAALIDAANGVEADVPTTATAPSAPPADETPRSPMAAALTAGQKAAVTRAANKAKRDAELLAAKVEPLRPTNIDPATGKEVILKEVIDPETKEVKQVPVETASDPDAEDAFDAAVDAAAAASDDDEAAALADAE